MQQFLEDDGSIAPPLSVVRWTVANRNGSEASIYTSFAEQGGVFGIENDPIATGNLSPY